jgi:Flp pilus assembly pilin Flp
MNSGETIRAKVELPCSIRLNGSELRIARGVTEEVTRESLIVVISSLAGNGWLKAASNVMIAIELPVKGNFEPRVLECAATVSVVRASANGVRIVAKVSRMAVIDRDAAAPAKVRPVKHSCAAGTVPAIPRSQNDNPVIPRNHLTKQKTNKRGEHTMSFLKNFFVEEDGQDMVEYGLVVSLVVIAGVVGYTAFGTAISTGISKVTSSVTADL